MAIEPQDRSEDIYAVLPALAFGMCLQVPAIHLNVTVLSYPHNLSLILLSSNTVSVRTKLLNDAPSTP